MNLHTLLRSLPFVQLPVHNPEVESIESNHKKVIAGSLFICIKGYVFDGHQFAEEAVKSGAVAIISEQPLDLPVPVIVVKDTKVAMAVLADAFYQHPTQKLHLIGVTGTNGKTTTTHLIDQIFRTFQRKTGLIGTLYMKIDDETVETKNTTPDSLVLQSIFHEMVEKHVDTAIMEVSSHALVQGRVNGCDFDIAIFTNLTQDHLDFHHTMAEYKQAKSLLFSKLGNTYNENKPKFAIFNLDDPVSKEYMTYTSAHMITYGIHSDADFTAKDIMINHNGMSFILHSPEGVHHVSLKLMGQFNIYNALAAMAAAYVSNIPIDIIIEAIENAAGVPGRFESVANDQEFAVIVDYAHTPDSLENVLKTIKQFAKKNIYCIVGCGGDRDPLKRPLMAKIACKYATHPIFTSDNPRSEDPLKILEDMEKGVIGDTYKVIPDRKQAIFHAIQAAVSGDIVLIAGKGHETYQIIGNEVLDFDDRKIALEAIKSR